MDQLVAILTAPRFSALDILGGFIAGSITFSFIVSVVYTRAITNITYMQSIFHRLKSASERSEEFIPQSVEISVKYNALLKKLKQQRAKPLKL